MCIRDSYYCGDINLQNGTCAPTSNLRVAHCSDTNCTAATITALETAGVVGLRSSVTIGPDGLGLISHYDETNEDLKVAHCSNINCTAATLLAVDTGGSVGDGTSITTGADGLGLIAYVDLTNLDLKVAHCANQFCSPYLRRR